MLTEEREEKEEELKQAHTNRKVRTDNKTTKQSDGETDRQTDTVQVVYLLLK